MPTTTASTEARHSCASARLSSPLIHLRVARARGDLAVERHRRLEQHPRAPDARVLAKRLVEQPRARRQLAVGDDDLDALVAQDAQAAPRGLLGRVVGGDDDAADACREDRVGARRRLALVTARLQRHVQRRVGQILHAACLDRVDLGVRGAEAFVPALADHLLAARDDRADDRVGLDRARAVARELDRAREVRHVGVDADRHACHQDNPAQRPHTVRRAGGRRSSAVRGGDRRAGSSQSSSRSRTRRLRRSARPSIDTARRDRPLRRVRAAPCSRRPPAAPVAGRRTTRPDCVEPLITVQ